LKANWKNLKVRKILLSFAEAAAEVNKPKLFEQSKGSLQMQVYPNPNDGSFTVKFNMIKNEKLTVTLINGKGKKIIEETLLNLSVGENVFNRTIRKLENGGVFFLTLETASEKATQKIIVEP